MTERLSRHFTASKYVSMNLCMYVCAYAYVYFLFVCLSLISFIANQLGTNFFLRALQQTLIQYIRNILRAFNTQNIMRLVTLLPSHILLMTNLKHKDISVLPKVIQLVNGKLEFKSKLLDSGVQALNFSMLYFLAGSSFISITIL